MLSSAAKELLSTAGGDVRILGIDYGDRRIGLAVSDPGAIIARGLPTLKNEGEAETLAAIRRLAEEYEVAEIVVGLPRNMDDSLGPQAQKTMRFAEQLKVLGRKIHFVDERLTTEQAKRVMTEAGLSRGQQHRRVDRVAAQFILQIYLDSSRRLKPED
jgi:putative Holliday junction resolvase